MTKLRLAYISLFCISLSGCGASIPECSNKAIQALVLERIKTEKLNQLLSARVSSPGFRVIAKLGEDDEATPAEIASQISSGNFDYSSWSKYRGTHEWIGVVVKHVDVEWETKFPRGDDGQLDSIQTEATDEASAKTTCSAMWLGAKDGMPITYTAARLENGNDFSVELTAF